MDQAFITAPFYPPAQLVTGIVVNKEGKRFVAEDSYHSRTSGFVMDQPDQAAYLIVDSAHIEHPDFPLCPFIDGWETVEEMEQALGIPTGELAETLASYNENAARKEDPDFHKHPDWLEPQDTGPWGAYDLTLGKAMYAGFTMGGMRVALDGEVQREDGSVIEGLYAAGACAVNIAQDGKGYASGTQLAEGSYFGRRAGRHAARKVPRVNRLVLPGASGGMRPMATQIESATAPHLVEPELKYVTDATFKEFHKAIARGFQEQPRRAPGPGSQDLRQEADVRLQGRPALGLDLRRLRAAAHRARWRDACRPRRSPS